MDNRLNPPKEMLRRSIFACFLLSTVAGFWLLVSVVIDWGLFRFIALITCTIGSSTLHYLGHRFFTFATIRETMIITSLPARLTPRLQKVYKETLALIEKLEDPDLKPWDRHEYRSRMNDIVKSEPLIFDLLSEEIRHVHPTVDQFRSS